MHPTETVKRPRNLLPFAAALFVSACGTPPASDGVTEVARPDASLASTSAALKNAQPTDAYPSVVAIETSQGLCSASLVTNRVLVTAAHCVSQLGPIANVVVGQRAAGDPELRAKVIFQGPFHVSVHPDFDPSPPPGETWRYANDIAVLTVKQATPSGARITIPGAVPMPLYAGLVDHWTVTTDASQGLGLDFEGVGFGRGSSGGSCAVNGAGEKRRGDMLFAGDSVITLGGVERLLTAWPSDQPWPPSDRLFMAADAPALPCHGDSGSPAIFDGMQVGVLSAIFTDGQSPEPLAGLYVLLRNHLDWIREAVDATGDGPMYCHEEGDESLVLAGPYGIDHEGSTSSRRLRCTHLTPSGPTCTWRNITGGGLPGGKQIGIAHSVGPCTTDQREQILSNGQVIATRYFIWPRFEQCTWQYSGGGYIGDGLSSAVYRPKGTCGQTQKIIYYRNGSVDEIAYTERPSFDECTWQTQSETDYGSFLSAIRQTPSGVCEHRERTIWSGGGDVKRIDYR